MIRFRLAVTGVALAALLAASAALAQGPGGGPGGRGGRGFEPGAAGLALNQLGLTDAQREQVREIRDRYREQARDLSRRLADLAAKQRQAIETLPVNETLIMSATQDMTQARIEMAIQEARIHADVWSVLTPEQQAKATKLRAERKARLEQRRQERQTR